MSVDLTSVIHAMAAVLATEEQNLRLEQAVYGLDARDELSLQSLLAHGLSPSFCVAREVYYPPAANDPASRKSARLRCDLVITPLGRPLAPETISLFDAPNPCPPNEALWLEVKLASQFREGGVIHTGYGQQWRSAIIADLQKIEANTSIHHGAIVQIVFTESEDILKKDLDLFEQTLLEKELLAGERVVQSTPILDRIGHRLCSVACWPTVQRG